MPPLPASGSPEAVAASVNDLGLDLLAQATGPQQNTALSPYSVQTALAMVYAGASGETRREMARVLHYKGKEADLFGALASLQRQLGELTQRTTRLASESRQSGGPSEPITLTMANRIFGQRGYDFRDSYQSLLKQTFGAPLEQMNFLENPASCAQSINRWVKSQTQGRIADLIPANALSKDTRLVLANAIYLKAPWAREFEESATKSGLFHLSGGQDVAVPMMKRQDTFGYAVHEGFEAISLPYSDPDLQFLILLPNTATGLPKLESSLTANLLNEAANLKRQDVVLYLPKFQIEPPLFALRKTLEILGMTSAFDSPQGSANFDGIAPRRPNDYLYISEIFHKTLVEIDEKGTEAAAATAVVMMRATAHLQDKPKPIEVRVDRPFFFAIQHRPSGACLFMGRVTDPR